MFMLHLWNESPVSALQGGRWYTYDIKTSPRQSLHSVGSLHPDLERLISNYLALCFIWLFGIVVAQVVEAL